MYYVMKHRVVALLMGCVTLASMVFSVSAAGSSPNGVGGSLMNNVEISFDGYCDGMSLQQLPSGLIEGVRTGCTDEAVAGSTSDGPEPGLNAKVYFRSAQVYETFLTEDGYFEIYSRGRLVNSGTWSYGTPNLMRSTSSELPSEDP